MTQLARPVHASVELLLTVVIPVTTIRLDQIASAVCERDSAVVTVDRDDADQSFVNEVLQAVVAAIENVIA